MTQDPVLGRRVWSDRQLRQRLAEDEANAGVSPGAAPAGVPIVRKFPFAFDAPDLLTGHTVYTPTIGDILLDAWVQIDVAWDGTTPKGDAGMFNNVGDGLWGRSFQPLEMVIPDIGPLNNGGVFSSNHIISIGPDLRANASLATGIAHNDFDGEGLGTGQVARQAPGLFTTDDPFQVVVSQDGTITGADPGSTRGSAVLYLVTATPVAATPA